MSAWLALIIDGLCGAVAARAPKNPEAAPLLVLLWSRLRRLAARFDRLVRQVDAGTLPTPRLRAARTASARPRQRWPSGFAWLVPLVPEAASYGSQLRHLLLQPEMVALIAAAPQAGRMFGPLRQMLAVQMGTHNPKPAKVRAPVPAIPGSGGSGCFNSAWPGHGFGWRERRERRPREAAMIGGGLEWSG